MSATAQGEAPPFIEKIAQCAERGAAHLDERNDEDQKKPQAEILVTLALDLYDIHRTDVDEPFAIRKDGPNVALMFRGSRDALRASMAREFRAKFKRTPNASAIADALVVLQGEALDRQPKPVHLRVAEHDGGIVIDLGRQDGRVVIVRPGRWEVSDRSPIIFRRSALSGELPFPKRGGSVDMLRTTLNVNADSWPLLLGWMLASFIPGIPHPVALLGGEHGAAKTTTARTIVSLTDPSPAPVRSQPNDPESWVMAASGSWVVAVDNVSAINSWWSDSLCKAVTGDGMVRRKLYTDSELAVVAFRRCIILTSIDAGALRGDLGDRILMVDLAPIPTSKRRSEADLDGALARDRPTILGALLDVLAGVLAELPLVHLTEHPRMADFGRVLAAMDKHLGTDSLSRYVGQRGRVVQEVLDGDPVAGAIEDLLVLGTWEGTAGDLLKRITPAGPRPHGWPQGPRALVARLKRLAPALRQVGIRIHSPEARSNRGRVIRIECSEDSSRKPSQPSQQSPSEGGCRDAQPDTLDCRDRGAGHASRDGRDGRDGHSPVPSDAVKELI